MSKNTKIKEFIASRLAQLDTEYQDCSDPLKKIKLSTMRTSFANIMNVYLGEDQQCGISYLKQAQTYYGSDCFEQAIYYAQLAKKHSKNAEILEESLLLQLNCLLRLDKAEEAHDLVNQINSDNRKQEVLEIKAQIMEKIGNEEQTMKVMDSLQEIIKDKFSSRSVEMGLHLIEKGRKKGTFNHYEKALEEIQQGLNILIEVKFRDHAKTSKVYIQMALFQRKLENLDSEYSSLVCAQSIIRQIPNMEKELIDLMHKIVVNLTEREQLEDSLKELFKIEALEKHIYGESSSIVGKTIKKISEVLVKMNKKVEAKKYDQEYSRIISCNERKGMNRDKPLKYVQIKNHH